MERLLPITERGVLVAMSARVLGTNPFVVPNRMNPVSISPRLGIQAREE